ncbi:hypothetical protein O181_034172 [Austropuccinia psidii MF-1]|uniref:Uncharacterized protein n=1 Tax=Austropuccinia psidii MF-1 TaxID=1389203 RepID=A0A9Q3H7U4_9BASI|nr:hypothetical protein [Austropuccinia psidii MF-1]
MQGSRLRCLIICTLRCSLLLPTGAPAPTPTGMIDFFAIDGETHGEKLLSAESDVTDQRHLAHTQPSSSYSRKRPSGVALCLHDHTDEQNGLKPKKGHWALEEDQTFNSLSPEPDVTENAILSAPLVSCPAKQPGEEYPCSQSELDQQKSIRALHSSPNLSNPFKSKEMLRTDRPVESLQEHVSDQETLPSHSCQVKTNQNLDNKGKKLMFYKNNLPSANEDFKQKVGRKTLVLPIINSQNPTFMGLNFIKPTLKGWKNSQREELLASLVPLGLPAYQEHNLDGIYSDFDQLQSHESHIPAVNSRWPKAKLEIWMKIESLLSFISSMQKNILWDLPPQILLNEQEKPSAFQEFIYHKILKVDGVISWAMKSKPDSKNLPQASYLQALILKYFSNSSNDPPTVVKGLSSEDVTVSQTEILRLEISLLSLEHYYRFTYKFLWENFLRDTGKFIEFLFVRKTSIQKSQIRELNSNFGHDLRKIQMVPCKDTLQSFPIIQSKEEKSSTKTKIPAKSQTKPVRINSSEKILHSELEEFEDWEYKIIQNKSAESVREPPELRETITANLNALRKGFFQKVRYYKPQFGTLEETPTEIMLNSFKDLFLEVFSLNCPFLNVIGSGLPQTEIEKEHIKIQNWVFRKCSMMNIWELISERGNNITEGDKQSPLTLFSRFLTLDQERLVGKSEAKQSSVEDKRDKLRKVIALTLLFNYYEDVNGDKSRAFFGMSDPSETFKRVFVVTIQRAQKHSRWENRGPRKYQLSQPVLPWENTHLKCRRPNWISNLQDSLRESYRNLRASALRLLPVGIPDH